MIDPRLDIMRQESGEPTSQDEACDCLIRGAEALALITPKLTLGEARIVLALLVESWAHKPPQSYQDDVASWSVRKAESTQGSIDDTDAELQTHIGAQASGAYALAPWPWPVLTEKSRSLMPGSVTLVCGSPGASKSWFALSCLRYWTANNIESSVLMLEETRKWHLQRALTQCSGNPDLLRPEWISANSEKALAIYDTHSEELSLIRSRLVCEGNWTMDQCAKWVEEQCKLHKRILIVDPISLADNGRDKPWDADRKFMARAKVAIEKSGASLILVTHPRKAQGGKSQGPPQLDDLAGGAAYGRACASALWVSGVADESPVCIVGGDGRVFESTVHKTIRIIKARNSVGCGSMVAYTFRNLQFNELGLLATSTSRAGADRGRKLTQEPQQSEDVF